jgi:hypothetical protein
MPLPQHDRYGYSPIDMRQDYDWPDGRRLAFYVCVCVEAQAFGAGVGEDPANLHAPQTQRNFGWRDYGARVGLWRLLALLDELGLPVTLAVNSLVYSQQPRLAARLVLRSTTHDDEIVAHGRTSSERLDQMWDIDAAQIIGDVTTVLRGAHGEPPAGWLSPGFAESRNMPDLLQEAGYRYLLDWPADDQPFWVQTRAGRILSVPFPLELNDTTAVLHRHHSGREFADMVVNQFDAMLLQSDDRPLVYALALHPYVVGQPFRLRALRQALTHCAAQARAARVWLTRPGAIAAHCARLGMRIP